MAEVKHGDTVDVNYTGKLNNGVVFDTSVDREPLRVRIGGEQVIPGFEQAIIGMSPGESKTITIPADEAYGQHRRELIAVIDRDRFPENLQPEIGREFQVQQPGGELFDVTVVEVSEASVVLDANHPLAGEDLTFDICLVQII
jgi:peptidylprolyl isomerase